MEYFKLIFSFLLIICIGSFFTACEEGTVHNPCEIDFDQEKMFRDLSEQMIIPQWDSLMRDFHAMDESAEAFVNAPTVGRLDSLRSDYLDTYERWQRVRVFTIGPAEEIMLKERVNSFPPDIDRMQMILSSDSIDFTLSENKFARGFPALDYLLYGVEQSSEAIVMHYASDADAGAFLLANLDFMEQSLEHVWQAWDGEYPGEFINNTGMAEGTSLSQLVNHINLRYEAMRRNKLGIPSGIAALGIEHPEKVEAYFSGHSLELLESALIGMKNAFTSGTGLGLDDYLSAAHAQTSTDEPLESVIMEQFQSALEEVRQIQEPLSDAIENDADAVETAYRAMARQTVYLKTDLPAALCVSITYVDNPSDSD